MNHSRSRKAFTLVEILVVIVILGIMGAMVTTAVSGVTSTAKQSRTKNIIAIVDSVLAEHHENLKYRPLPVEIPLMWKELDKRDASSDTGTLGYEVLLREASRIRLMMARDLQRMELPDRYTDILQGPTDLYAAATLLKKVDGKIKAMRSDKSQRLAFRVEFSGTSKQYVYQRRIGDKTAHPEFRTHQGAECLYLIMASSFVGGAPALDAIPTANIGDTDEDGMPEILDGWGKPLRFVRWPIGYLYDKEALIDKSKPEDHDMFLCDYAYDNPGLEKPWSIKPLVFSCGSDGESGLITDPDDNSLFSYQANWSWPIAKCGPEEKEGRNEPYWFPDPYLRGSSRSILPGGRRPGDTTTVDDITNYQLQVSP